MKRKKLLILSDAPTAPTGLGRIARELAFNIHFHMQDMFEVATFGPSGTYSRHIPFMQYPATVCNNNVLPELAKVWKDFAGDEEGICLSIWNIGWLSWMAQPEKLPAGTLKDFLTNLPFQWWAYIPIDGHCAQGGIPELAPILKGTDRLLAYTQYGADVIDQTLGLNLSVTPHLPHGLDTGVFYPHDRNKARETFVKCILDMEQGPIHEDIMLVGVVATNSARKDWYLAFEVCADLLRRGVNVGLWAHTDYFEKCWNLSALAKQFGMERRTMYSNRLLSDEEMAWGYSACDVTLGIGSGEGWGFPLAESMACGVPVIHGNYAGGAEFIQPQLLVDPMIFKGEGLYGIKRPVYRASDWADKVCSIVGANFGQHSILPPYIDWKNAWPEWEKWLRSGI